MKNRNQDIDDNILKVMQSQDQVRQAIQTGIRAALLKHKQAGNPVCESRDGKVVWISPEKIPVDVNNNSEIK